MVAPSSAGRGSGSESAWHRLVCSSSRPDSARAREAQMQLRVEERKGGSKGKGKAGEDGGKNGAGQWTCQRQRGWVGRAAGRRAWLMGSVAEGGPVDRC